MSRPSERSGKTVFDYFSYFDRDSDGNSFGGTMRLKINQFFKASRKFVFAVAMSGLVLMPVGAEAGWFRNLVTSVVSTVIGLPAPSNAVTYVLNQTLNIFTNCSNSSHDGVRGQCFDSNEQAKINAAISILRARAYYVNRGGAIDPYSFFRAHTTNLINWDSAQMRNTYLVGYAAGCNNGSTNWGCHTIDGSTFITNTGLALDPVEMAGFLVHEADHYNKTHSCGDTADADINGPYGLEALYLKSISRNPVAGMTASQRSLAESRAWGIANYQLCSNTAARDQVLNYYNTASMAIPVYYPPPPRYNCSLCMEP